MKRQALPAISPAIKEVWEKFSRWRQDRKHRSVIPEELWEEADKAY